MSVTRRNAFVLCLIVLFGYEAYALFVREWGLSAHEPRPADRNLTREVNADTPLSQTFRIHADGFSGIEIFARPSEQPAAGPLEVTVSRQIGETWMPVRRTQSWIPRASICPGLALVRALARAR